ncbi:MAG TPA: MFS transporter, partial [Microbacterium sp.]|nr:MFS transporter [Microbacterium sp.]
GFLAAGVILLAAFVWIESRVTQPLLPLRVITDRVRGGAFLIQAVAGSVMIGATLYLTLHLQIVMQMSALMSGLASLPLTAAIMLVAPFATKLLPRIGPRPLLIAGPLIVSVALLYLSRITADGSYAVQVLPGLIVMGVGMAMIFVPLQNIALAGVAPHDAGAASATANSAMQIGGSIGLSVFTAVYISAVGTASPGNLDAMADGYGATFLAAAIGMVVASAIAIFLIRGDKSVLLPGSAQPVPAHA